MTNETHNALMQYRDQFINIRNNTLGLELTLFANDRETIDAVTQIARAAGHKVKKLVIGKGTVDAEMKLQIS